MNILKSAERFGKNVLTFLLKILIKQKLIDPDKINTSSINKVLIIRQDRRIGNLILTTPLIQKTKTIFPNAKIDVLMSQSIQSLYEDHPYLNKIYPFDHKGFIKNPFRLIKIISTLRKNKYDIVIESSNPAGASFLNGYLTYLTKSPIRIGFNKGRGSIFTNVHVAPDRTKHYYIIQQDLVNIFSDDKNYFKPEIFSNKKEIKKISDLLKERFSFSDNTKIAGIWIGARGKKKWNIENFKILFDRIKSETGYSPVLAFGIEEKEDFKKIDTKKYNALEIIDLKKLKAFISVCNVFICGDTGPLHFSYALGTPTVGVFLQDTYLRYGYTDGTKNFIVKPDNYKKMIDNILSNIENIL